MKKALALILTAAMLLSCVVITASAERVWSKEDKVLRESTVTVLGSNFAGVAYNDPISSGDYTAKFVVMGDPATNDENKGFESTAFCNGSPLLNQVNNTIGFQGAPSSVAFTFEPGVWYTIEYVVSGNTTTIVVDGETIGTIDAYMDANFYGSWYRMYVDEVSYVFENGKTWGDDFEDGADDIFGGTIETVKETETLYTNENVEFSTSTVTVLGSNFAGVAYNDPISSGDYTAKFVVMGDPATNDENKGFESTAFCNGSPLLNQVNNTIGFQGAPSSVAFTFEPGVWYTIEYVVSGDTTTIVVDGETIGTIDAYMDANFYGSWYRMYVDEVSYVFENGKTWGDDFEDESDDIFGGTIETIAKAGAAHDLGMYYWAFNYMDGHYLYPDVKLTGKDVAFDFQFNSLTATDGNTNNAANWGNMFVLDLQADKVGVNSASLDYDFKADTWYHVEFINDGSSTAIYIDGSLVGTVAAVFGERWIGGLHGIDIDNLQIGDYFEDFEDQNFAKGSDTAGAAVAYDFPEPVEIDPYEELAAKGPVAEGDAVMFTTTKAAGGSSYFYNPGDYPDVKSSKTVYSFDLALVPNDGEGFDEAGKTWFGIWRDTGSKRFKVGYDVNNTQLSGFAGEGDAVVGFDWGEFTATNFHDVIMIFKGTKAQIYIDGTLIYEGASGTPGINGSGATLFEVFNGSAIVDNFTVYAPDSLDVLYEGFGKLESNGNFERAYDWTIGAGCDVNPHVYGNTVRTTDPTCYSLGVDTLYCAICGEVMGTNNVDMIDHKYANYDINRTENGLIYTYCRNSGCVEKRFVTPTDEAYTGTIHAYFDMQDDFMSVIGKYSESEPYWGHVFTYENGVARADARNYPGSYSKFSLDDSISSYVDGKDWSLNFDFTYNGTWDTDDNKNGYEHYLTFMLCGSNSVWLIFNMDDMTITVTGNKFAGYNLVEEGCKYNFVEGGTYNVQISYWQHEIIDPDDPEGWMDDDGNMQYSYVLDCALYVTINNETVIAYDYANMGYDCQSIAFSDSDSKFRTTYQQNFGVDYSIDNFVVGTHDFAWTERTYEGDVNGDNYLDSLDAVAMRQYLAKVIDGSTLAHARWDINADGEINAKDQLALRKMLAA